ncbi:MAG: PAS domain-containing protein [Phycisphaerales bacterium]|nr:PAS domain-containing protein [Phycisphaerales bacterium]
MSPIVTSASATGRLDAGYLESLFLSAGLGIIACNNEAEIVAANPAATRLFGGTDRRLHGPVAALFAEADREAVEQMFDTVRTTFEPLEFRTRIGGTDADPLEYAVWFTPVLDADATVRGVSLWFRDVTERMRLRRTLKERERLASLGTLSRGVAHHYNNLLCCIATSVEYAINMNTTSAMRRALQRTADAVGRAAQMTRQLLAFAQADHSEGDLSDLTETVLFYCDENEQRLAQQHIKLLVDWQMLPIVPVRRDQVMIIMSNIVDNALDAMPSGGTLAVTLARRDENSVALSITDTGEGVDPRYIERIFEPFFTTKGALGQGAGRNAGMGLAVVHGLVGEMHGSITVSNIPGQGARFDIVLPVQR